MRSTTTEIEQPSFPDLYENNVLRLTVGQSIDFESFGIVFKPDKTYTLIFFYSRLTVLLNGKIDPVMWRPIKF